MPSAAAPPELVPRAVLEQGRRVYTGVVVVLLLVGVVAALAGAALGADGARGGGPDGDGAGWLALAAGTAGLWAVLALVHLLRGGLPVVLLVGVGLVCAAVLPQLVGAASPSAAQGALRVLPTVASAVLWLLAGTPGRAAVVLGRALVAGGVALVVVSASAAVAGLGAVDLVGPLVTALLAVGTLVVAERSADRTGRSLAARREATRDLAVARDLAAARHRLDARLHDVVLGALAAVETADPARAGAVRELAAEALALLVEADPAAPAERVGGGREGRPEVPPASDDLETALVRLARRTEAEGVVVALRRGGPPPRRGTSAPPVGEAELEALLGAAGECLRNVVRHARTRSAVVVWSRDAVGAQVLVVDAGAGFVPAAVAPSSLGLARSVVGRLEAVGGRAAVRSRPGHGTVAALFVPAVGARA